jgi:hypothetical protein
MPDPSKLFIDQGKLDEFKIKAIIKEQELKD